MHFNTEHIYYSAEAEKFLHSAQSADHLARFHELAAKNGDIGYDWGKYCLPGDFPRMAIYPGITGIIITSDHDYDESHPAGTSLNDIFNAHYFSYAQFLGDADHSDVDPTHNYLGVTDKSCDTIGEGELCVMSPNYFSIRPKQAPSAYIGIHLLTVTLTDENGVEHSSAIEMDFDSLYITPAPDTESAGTLRRRTRPTSSPPTGRARHPTSRPMNIKSGADSSFPKYFPIFALNAIR